MISIEQVDSIPDSVMEVLTDEAKADLRYYDGVHKAVSKLSPEIWLVMQNEAPLLAVGAVRLNRLSPIAELWVYATENLNWMHLPLMREAINKRLPERMVASYPGARMFARVHTPKSVRFVEFFGGRFVEEQDGVKVYEVGPC